MGVSGPIKTPVSSCLYHTGPRMLLTMQPSLHRPLITITGTPIMYCHGDISVVVISSLCSGVIFHLWLDELSSVGWMVASIHRYTYISVHRLLFTPLLFISKECVNQEYMPLRSATGLPEVDSGITSLGQPAPVFSRPSHVPPPPCYNHPVVHERAVLSPT